MENNEKLYLISTLISTLNETINPLMNARKTEAVDVVADKIVELVNQIDVK